MKWVAIGLTIFGVVSAVVLVVQIARTHGLDGYDCNQEAYEKQKAIPWWKRIG